MGKHRLVAETGAGQHGVATATAAALLGIECVVYMGEVDMERQALNVFRMRLLGAEVGPPLRQPHAQGRRQRGHARLGGHGRVTHYCLGSVMGPHPYPWMVREFHRVIGDEAREQCRACSGRTPTSSPRASAAAPTPSASSPGSPTPTPSWSASSPPAARPSAAACPGIVHGMKSYLMQDEFGQVLEAQSISAGLDYPGVGPEHAHLADIGRARYEQVTDAEVLDAFQLLSRTEGIIPALEPAHALAWVLRAATSWPARPCW
jgi:tryptophan synthase beta chain